MSKSCRRSRNVLKASAPRVNVVTVIRGYERKEGQSSMHLSKKSVSCLTKKSIPKGSQPANWHCVLKKDHQWKKAPVGAGWGGVLRRVEHVRVP